MGVPIKYCSSRGTRILGPSFLLAVEAYVDVYVSMYVWSGLHNAKYFLVKAPAYVCIYIYIYIHIFFLFYIHTPNSDSCGSCL